MFEPQRSLNIWDYLDDLPYMPSREDRDRLVKSGEEKRVQIWDYFFRIDPDDVGKPQKNEISEIKDKVSERIAKHNQVQQAIKNHVANLHNRIFQKRVNSFSLGTISFILAWLFNKVLLDYDLHYRYSDEVFYILILYGVVLWFTMGIVGWNEKSEINDYMEELRSLNRERDLYIKERLNRKNTLRNEIKGLKKQIPACPSYDRVREWLDDDFRGLYERSVQITALGNRLVPIEAGDYYENGKPIRVSNPIYVLGPGELQDREKIPKIFAKEIRPDLNKHLLAKKSHNIKDQNRFDVLYGVYYLEHILIADDMLATYGLFYDFITGKYHAEQVTEQYYQDVVAIAITHEFREIVLGVNQQEIKYIEDAPTFTLSLSSGEHRKVTFVSEKYFMEIREKLHVAEDDIAKISWIGRAQVDADIASRALRFQLRQHKLILSEGISQGT
jgi:hypothetical protein